VLSHRGWGRLHRGRQDPPDKRRFYIEDFVRGEWSAAEVDRIVKQIAVADGLSVAIREEQEPSSAGKAVIAARTMDIRMVRFWRST
jgi:phage terminase large subunit-like protein